MLYPSLVLALLAAVCLSEKNQRHLLPLFVQVTTLDQATAFVQAPLLTHAATPAVADNTLTIKQKSTLPISKTRQDKSLFRSLLGTYLPPVERTSCVVLLCSHLALMDFRRTCATTIRHRLPLAPVIRST